MWSQNTHFPTSHLRILRIFLIYCLRKKASLPDEAPCHPTLHIGSICNIRAVLKKQKHNTIRTDTQPEKKSCRNLP